MVRSRFTEEQIADFLQQSKNGVPNKALCEEYGFSNSTLRRWQEKHAESIRRIKTDRIYREDSLFMLHCRSHIAYPYVS